MNYLFPTITHIDQVLAAIEGRQEFVVAVKEGDYTVINYVVMANDTFPPVNTVHDAIRRECRGIIFRTSTGEVIHRRLHKFFNANEKEETQVCNIRFDRPHVILEKLDGSMITPVRTDSGRRWGTKMGVTEVALPVEEFVKDKQNYADLCDYFEERGFTPIFEWCSRKQRIVIDYPEDQLVLIAARNNVSGEYLQYRDLAFACNKFSVPLVKQYAGSAASMQALVDEIKDLEDAEGFVLRFDDGHMVKIKGEWYLGLHKTKDALSREKNVVEMIVSEKADDVKAFMLDEDRSKFEVFERDFWRGVAANVVMLNTLMADEGAKYQDRKDFAVEFVQKQEKHLQPFLYAMRSGKDPLDLLKDAILKSCSTQTKLEEARWMFGVKWDEVGGEE